MGLVFPVCGLCTTHPFSENHYIGGDALVNGFEHGNCRYDINVLLLTPVILCRCRVSELGQNEPRGWWVVGDRWKKENRNTYNSL